MSNFDLFDLLELTRLPKTGRGGTFTCPQSAPYQENDEAYLSCGPGYRLPSQTHSKVVVPEGILKWDPDPLDCLPLTELMELPHTGTKGKFTSLQTAPYHVGDTATLTCDLGYRIPVHRSVATVVVKNNQLVWEPESIDCQPVLCGEPPIPTFGRTSNNEYYFPKFFTYECFEGYRFNQSLNQFFCSVSGQWSPPIKGVDCVRIECPELKDPLHGSVSFLDRFYDSVATFQCDPGMEIVQGEKTRVCQNDGQWSGEEVRCDIVPCPPIDPRATVAFSNHPIAVIDCGQKKTVTLKCQNGQWSQSYPYCPSLGVVPPAAPKSVATKPSVVKQNTHTIKSVVDPRVKSWSVSVGWLLLLVIGFCFMLLTWRIIFKNKYFISVENVLKPKFEIA